MSGTTFLISDTHHCHEKCLDIENNRRPFASSQEMDEAIIANWNAVVSPKDEVIHLGDVWWKRKDSTPLKEILQRLNGRILLVPGNHDRHLREEDLRLFHEILPPLCRIERGGIKAILCHYPLREWQGSQDGKVHLHGHVHSTPARPYEDTPGALDVGVDLHGFRPILFSQAVCIARNAWEAWAAKQPPSTRKADREE